MKLCAKFFLVLFLLTCLSTSVFALEPNVRKAMLANQAMTFDHIEKITTVSLTATTVMTPSDIVSTNTAAVYYLPDSFNYPICLEIQNHGTASITYNEYSTTVATGIDVPTAGDPILLSDSDDQSININDKLTRLVFYQAPNYSFSTAGTNSVTFTVKSIKSTE